MRALLRSSLLFLVAGLAACAANTVGSEAEDGNTARLTVENRSSLDMDIYAIRDRRESRIGFVAGGETASFQLPPGLIAGTGSLQFEARPARRSGSRVPSDLYLIRPGEEVVWSIPPQ